MPETLTPVIPQNITVHLGPPSSSAENVTVNFVDYIKNVASSEIYPRRRFAQTFTPLSVLRLTAFIPNGILHAGMILI